MNNNLSIKDTWEDELEFTLIDKVGFGSEQEVIVATRTRDAEEIKRIGMVVLSMDDARNLHNWLGELLGFECLEK